MGDEDLLRAPAVEQLRRLRPVRQAGENLRLGGVGFQEADIGEKLLLGLPVPVDHAAVLLPTEHALHVDGQHGALCGEGQEFIGNVAAHKARQVPDLGVNLLRDLLGPVGVDFAVHGGGPALPVRSMVDVFGDEGVGAVEGEHRDVGGGGEGVLQVHLGGVRLGQDGGFVPHVGGGKAGVVHRAADGLDGGSVIVHIGVLGNFSNNQGVELAHFASSLRMASSASTNSWNAGLQRWNLWLSIMRL